MPKWTKYCCLHCSSIGTWLNGSALRSSFGKNLKSICGEMWSTVPCSETFKKWR